MGHLSLLLVVLYLCGVLPSHALRSLKENDVSYLDPENRRKRSDDAVLGAQAGARRYYIRNRRGLSFDNESYESRRVKIPTRKHHKHTERKSYVDDSYEKRRVSSHGGTDDLKDASIIENYTVFENARRRFNDEPRRDGRRRHHTFFDKSYERRRVKKHHHYARRSIPISEYYNDDNDLRDRRYAGLVDEIIRRSSYPNVGDLRRYIAAKLDLSNLPPSEPLKPGYTLIRPNKQMLKSSAGFPKDDPHLVYGNADNLGIRYGKYPFRNTYTDFRKQIPAKLDLSDLPPSEPLKPGYTLIRPNKQMLKSSAGFPKDDPHLVYGNANNLGIRYGKYPLRNTYTDFRKHVAAKLDLSDLPPSEPLKPGYTLIRPNKQMLKSSAGFPKDDPHLVYGNANNLGIRYGKYPLRNTYTDFRKHVAAKLDLSDLPPSEPLKPGYTLIRPNKQMLKSSAGFPKDDPHLVYGNANNLGIRYGKYPLRNTYTDFRKHVAAKLDLSDLPPSEPLKPGYTLIRPNKQMLKSSAGFPKDDPHLVYGNAENLGIRYGKWPYRNTYTDFRKDLADGIDQDSDPENDVLAIGGKTIQNSPDVRRYSDLRDEIMSMKQVKKKLKKYNPRPGQMGIAVSADGIKDILPDRRFKEKLLRSYMIETADNLHKYAPAEYELDSQFNLRRNSNCSDSDSVSSAERSIEKNPGNPYTIFSNKYKQNWIWNTKVSGDHMNINPWAPSFNSLGPSGAELFFGRKWWYFNQDDYIPFRRR